MRRILSFLLAGISIAAITYLLTQSDVMRDQIAPLLFRLTLIIRDTLRSWPDIVYWALFCVAMLVIGFMTVLRLFLMWLSESDAPLNNDPAIPIGPVQRYADAIENTRDGAFYRRQLARELAVFSFELFERPESGLPEIDAALAEGIPELTPAVTSFMREGTSRRDLSADNRLPTVKSLIAPSALEGLTAAIELLEAKLHIKQEAE